MRILVIDDDATFSRYLAEVLTHLGHVAEWVTDGLVGFERCLGRTFDLVICDVRMPLILGTELASELRRDLPNLPVVLISAFADDQLTAQAHERGAWLLSKPFDAAGLGEVLERAVTAPRFAS
ncbi:MAG: response regulator [Deltaproteobacteria bacterium]|nr:response regulator [Deltaproteobacteria bacterium]